MVLPIYATLERLDPALVDAAADLGLGHSPPCSRFGPALPPRHRRPISALVTLVFGVLILLSERVRST